MPQTERIRQLPLTYMNTREIKIAKGGQLNIDTDNEYSFAFVMQNKVSVALSTSYKHSEGNALSGELFMVPAHCQCRLTNTANQAVTIIWIRFMQEALQMPPSKEKPCALLDQLFDQSGFHPYRMPQLRSWILDFMDEGQPLNTALVYQLQSHLYALTASFIESVQKPKETEADLIVFVEQARQFMQDQSHLPMDIEELAKSSGSSSSRFYTAFKEQTGLSPHKYMTKLRLDASLHLLANAPGSIVEVAHSVGYGDEYYFSRLFKKHMGMTPTEYTACAKRKVANLNEVFAGDLFVLGITPYLSFDRGWQDHPAYVLEKLASAEPDMILIGPVSEELYQALSQIAPVTVLRWKEYSWKERLIDIGELLGLSSVAERWLSYYDMKVENARRHVKNLLGDEPFLVVHAMKNSFYIFGMKRRKLRDIFYDDLQVIPPSPAKQISMMKVDTLQEVAELDCENVLFLVHSATTEAYCSELEQQWRILKPSRLKKRCLFIRNYDSPLYNAVVNESLVEQMVTQLLVSAD
ncbi:AraC family transcriptional regulator [Paenibacillus agricola]|uniref:AraC family transcriptional regulator n=1 Tax=Paenibacillus agricola TaxID=2716264 RepID=A0ABX0J2N0_9BACL|nr:AraC family transcriptional regulator [Paenibacillus agricola]NHN29680.1 AraC family transcriptional regulator [Paenibacillus agricola]